MQNELDIVRDVSVRLEQGGLAYMLTGSMAMNYYAQPRMTRNIDVVVALATPSAVPSSRNRSSISFIRRASLSRLHRPQEQPVSPRRVRAA